MAMARRWNIQRGSSEAQGSFRGSPLDSRRIGRDTTTTAIVRANRQGQRPSTRPRMPVLTSPGLWPLNMTFSKRGEFGPLYAREPAWPHSCSLSHGGLDERPDVLQLRGILLGCANSTFVDVRIPSRVATSYKNSPVLGSDLPNSELDTSTTSFVADLAQSTISIFVPIPREFRGPPPLLLLLRTR